MAQWIEITEDNRDDWSRRGVYLYLGTRLYHENEQVHREDGPAVITPDHVERWYVRGNEITPEVKSLFHQNKWDLNKGLDTEQKLQEFKAKFVAA